MKKAFTLIEISVVLIIMSILISGVLSVSVTYINDAKKRATTEKIGQIYKALGNYMLANYRLPCPAPLNLVKGDASYGVSAGSAGDCNQANNGVYAHSTVSGVVYGALPFKELGLPENFGEDGFGLKFGYVLYEFLTISQYPNTPDFGANSFSTYLSSGSVITSISRPSGRLYSGAFYIISNGGNKFGGYGASSTTRNAASSNVKEQVNYVANQDDGNAVADFGIQTGHSLALNYESLSDDEFDDILFFKSWKQFIVDFDAMHLVACSMSGGFSSVYYPAISYKSSYCSAPFASILPTKKCGQFGSVMNIQECP